MNEFAIGCFYGFMSAGILALIFDRGSKKPRRKITRRVYHYQPSKTEFPQIFNHRKIEDYVFTMEGEEE